MSLLFGSLSKLPTPAPTEEPPTPSPDLVQVIAGGYQLDDPTYARLYGPGKYVVDYIGNIRVGHIGGTDQIVSHRFRATASGNVTSVKTDWPPGSGYAAGNGGTCRARIMPDDGTEDHFPDMDGTALSTGTLVMGMVGGVHSTNTGYTPVPMTAASPLVAGTLYHVVYDNTAASPSTNFFSVNNNITTYANGRSLRWVSPTDWATLYGTRTVGGGGAYSWDDWMDWAAGPGDDYYGPMLQIGLEGQVATIGHVVIEGGNVDDVGYIWTATSSLPVLEQFTPSEDKIVAGISFQTCARVAGVLLVEFKQGTTVLDSLTITVNPANHSNENGAAVLTWYDRQFSSPISLSADTAYDVVFTPQGSSTWAFPDMRNGRDYGFAKDAAFTESQAFAFNDGAFRPAYHWDHDAAAWGGGSNWRVVLHLAETTPAPPPAPPPPPPPPPPAPPPSGASAPTLQMFYDDMTISYNDGRMVGWDVYQNAGNHTPNYQSAGVSPANVAASVNGRGTHMPVWWKGSGAVSPEFKDSEIWPFWCPWAIVSAESDYNNQLLGTNVGVKIVIGRQIAIAVKTDDVKVVLRDTYKDQGYFKANREQQFWVNEPYTTRTNSVGGLDYVWDTDARSMHYIGVDGNNSAYAKSSGRINIGALTNTGTGAHGLKCLLVAMTIHMEPDVDGLNTSTSGARLLAYVGHDYMPTSNSGAENDQRPAVSHTRIKRLTSSPQWFCTATLLDGRQDHTVPSGTIAGVSFADFQNLGITF
jgi:hypothetical protein